MMALGLPKSPQEEDPPGIRSEHRRSLSRRILLGLGILFALLLIAAFIASFFIDGMIQSRSVASMNAELKGYHTELDRAHLQLIGGILTLRGLTIRQDAHPQPPVAQIPKMTAHLDWGGLFLGHVVADFTFTQPHFHVDLTQLSSESKSGRTVQEEGWQQALESVYPFKINLFRIIEGDIVYVDSNDPQLPLHLTDFNLSARNIRNIKSPNKTYPSPIHLDTNLAQSGRVVFEGNANFLAAPFPGLSTEYWISHVPLNQFTPELKHANMEISGGMLDSTGVMVYAPWGERAEVYNATIDGVRIRYLNLAQTQTREKQQMHTTKVAAQQANNQPGLLLKIDQLNLQHSDVGYEDRATSPAYTLFVSDFNGKLTNLSNHFSEGNSGLQATGKFMGNGDLKLTGSFRPEKSGPDMTNDLAIEHTNLISLNDLLQAYGKLRVARGDFSLYMQDTVKQGYMTGYVKPLFSNLQVYNYSQDKHKPLVTQAYKLAVGAASHILKNHKTDNVATQVNLSGQLSKPNMSTWQAFAEILHNAFIKAILPGFDRETAAANRASG